jgi:uncharacterized protein YjbJ (UPF0337 family)
MKSSTRDRIDGRIHEVKGTIKETLGQTIGDRDLEAEGADENLDGKVQKKVGEIKQLFEK